MDTSLLLPFACFIIGIIIICLTVKNRILSNNNLDWKEDLYKEHILQFKHNPPINSSFIIKIDFCKYPVYKDVQLYWELNDIIKQPIANLSKFSNKDIKEMYGCNGLQKLIAYEQNYFIFINKSYEYALFLYKNEKLQDSKIVLEYIINIGCENSRVYLLLNDIYKQLNCSNEFFDKLKEDANINVLNPIFLKQLINKLS